MSEKMVRIEKTGEHTISITFPIGTRAKLSRHVDLTELLRVLSNGNTNKDQAVVNLDAPVPM